MGNVGRKWAVCALLLAGAVTATGATKAARLRPRAVSTQSVQTRTFFVSITPNGAVPSHASCIFTANVSGGTAPYHYAWAVNNSPIGSDAQAVSYTNNGTGFRIDVNVTDNTGDTGYDSNIMTIGGSC